MVTSDSDTISKQYVNVLTDCGNELQLKDSLMDAMRTTWAEISAIKDTALQASEDARHELRAAFEAENDSLRGEIKRAHRKGFWSGLKLGLGAGTVLGVLAGSAVK